MTSSPWSTRCVRYGPLRRHSICWTCWGRTARKLTSQPALMAAVWLWATAQGVGSARQLEKLCVEHLAYRWLCGGIEIDGQTSRDFRLIHGNAFDKLLAHSMAALEAEGMIKDMASPDAESAQASKGAKPVRRRESLKTRAMVAAARVQELRKALDKDDPIADERHDRAGRWRTAQLQDARVKAALAQMNKHLRSRKRTARDEGENDREQALGPINDSARRRRTILAKTPLLGLGKAQSPFSLNPLEILRGRPLSFLKTNPKLLLPSTAK